MGKIKIMSSDMANRIKAGEIIERPINIIKELIENSMDANSSEIKIELVNAGIDSIKITDNGDGILKEDMPLVTKMHATSKISDNSDLFDIATFGFRGEALSSMAGVSRVTIISSTDGVNGYKYCNETLTTTSSNKGTTVMIEDLFYNTPVRYKNLKSVHYELSIITSYIQRLSLVMPDLNITLINDNKQIYLANFKNNIDAVVNNVYGIEVLKNKENIDFYTPNFHITGFIVKASVLRSNKRSMVIAINNRIVTNIEIQKAIIDGYKNYLFTTNYPICLINIKTNFDKVDVNIHPTKEKVKVERIEEILEELPKQINDILKNQVYNNVTKTPTFTQSLIKDTSTVNNYKNEELVSNFSENTNTNLEVIEPTWKLPIFNYIATFKRTYLLFESENGMYFADQHAMHERINYEKISKKLTNKNFTFQKLLLPLTITLDNETYNNAISKIEEFKDIGFIIEDFGINTIKVVEVEQIYSKMKIIENDITTLLNSKKTFSAMIDDIAIMMACKQSIKANDYINKMEVEILLDMLNNCEHPHTCPHGRPIFVLLSTYDIEKLFRRA